MDVSIRVVDQEARNAAIKRREEKEERKLEKDARHKKRRDQIVNRRLVRKVGRQVRRHLKHERKAYATGGPYGNAYMIYTCLRYRGGMWSLSVKCAEELVVDIVSLHKGVKIKTQDVAECYERNGTLWCRYIKISYILLPSY